MTHPVWAFVRPYLAGHDCYTVPRLGDWKIGQAAAYVFMCRAGFPIAPWQGVVIDVRRNGHRLVFRDDHTDQRETDVWLGIKADPRNHIYGISFRGGDGHGRWLMSGHTGYADEIGLVYPIAPF